MFSWLLRIVLDVEMSLEIQKPRVTPRRLYIEQHFSTSEFILQQTRNFLHQSKSYRKFIKVHLSVRQCGNKSSNKENISRLEN